MMYTGLAMSLMLIGGANGLVIGTPTARLTQQKITMADSNFYAVFHTFKRGKKDAFWESLADADFAAMAKAQHESGIFNHYFMPADVDGPVLCLWECKDTEMGSVAFKEFIDGPDSPAADLNNKVYPINEAAATPGSAWPTMPKTPVPTTGSFFWVQHAMNKGKNDEFWETVASVDMAAFAAANKAKGFHNHNFLPTTDPSCIFCVWETKEPMEAAEFQTFIDSEVFPGLMTNRVYPTMEGASLPSAAFTTSWLDETMKKIEEFSNFNLEEIVAKLKEATKM